MPERRLPSPLIFAGLMVWILTLTAWLSVWLGDRELAIAIAATFGAFLLAGKIAAIPLGLSLHLHPAIIFLIVLLPDMGAVLFFYPLTKGGLTLLGRWSGFVRRMHERALRTAERKDNLLARYGSFGLFVMALAPIGFYSPIVIAAIGQFFGLSAIRVLLPIFAAMIMMTAIWVLAIQAGFAAATAIDPRLPFVVSIGLLLLLVGRDAVKRLRKRGDTTPPEPADPPPSTVAPQRPDGPA